jgi:NodT family efflux transporter outer membrane factor (OMF) lipoprotein
MTAVSSPHRHARNAPLSIALMAVLFSACTVGPDFVPPKPQIPEHWSAAALAEKPAQLAEKPAQLAAWWDVFQDPELSSLIGRGLDANLDLRAAVLRVEEARTQRAVAAAGFWPSISADASYSRQRLSETTPTGSLFNSIGNVRLPGGAGISIPNPYNQFQLSADATWEMDLFGRVRRSVEAADASVQVSVEDQRLVRVSVLADVAQSYTELRGAQARLRVARENLATIEQLLELTRQRRAAGLTTHIDVSNAAAEAGATRAALPAFELQITEDINQLSRLLALEPGALRGELGTPAPVPSVPRDVSIGLPAELARRRPDIREAEANLHAATAEIGVAVADLFPRLTLSAMGGFQSETTGNLLSWASRFGSFGPALDLPVLDRGRWKTVRLYGVRAREAALAYQSTVLNALHEVENSAAAYHAELERRTWLDATVVQNRDALMLSRQRYENGVITFIDVLGMERSLQQNELALADSTTAASADLVGLYRALGGGWQQVPQPDAARIR